MPRKRDKEKAIKNGSDIPMTAEGYRNYEREKAQKALKIAKKVEAKKNKGRPQVVFRRKNKTACKTRSI